LEGLLPEDVENPAQSKLDELLLEIPESLELLETSSSCRSSSPDPQTMLPQSIDTSSDTPDASNPLIETLPDPESSQVQSGDAAEACQENWYVYDDPSQPVQPYEHKANVIESPGSNVDSTLFPSSPCADNSI